jgi:hypothetical protein
VVRQNGAQLKKDFSLPGSDAEKSGIFQSKWYIRFGCIESGHLFLPVSIIFQYFNFMLHYN